MALAAGEIRLRPITEDDQPFLRELYGSTRAEELSVVPWSDEQKRAFLDMQFRAQSVHYRKYYPDAEFLIIEHKDKPVGRLLLHRQPHDILIVDISLIPESRGRGIGTTLLRDVLAEGEATNRRVAIHVERFNPARRLYERLGFRFVRSDGVYDLMVK